MSDPIRGRWGLAFGLGAAFCCAVLVLVTGVRSIPAGAATITVAPRCETLALVSARTGAVVRAFPGFAYRPGFPSGRRFEDAVPDGRTGWFGIEYTALASGDASDARLAHMRSDGTVDRGWPIRLASFGEYALTRSGGRLYVGSALGVQAYDSATGAQLWSSPTMTLRANAPGRGSLVVALAATPSVVYVGGDFSRVGNESRALLAALDARSGHLLPWRIPALSESGTTAGLSTLAVTGTRLYLGGTFDSVGGQKRPGIAAVSAQTGALSPWSPRFQSWDGATSIAVDGSTVLVGGTFSQEGAFNTITGKPRDWAAATSDATRITVSRSTAFLGGNIRSSLRYARNNLAAVNLRTGVHTGWGPNLARFVSVGTLAASGGKVLVGGDFCNSVG